MISRNPLLPQLGSLTNTSGLAVGLLIGRTVSPADLPQRSMQPPPPRLLVHCCSSASPPARIPNISLYTSVTLSWTGRLLLTCNAGHSAQLLQQVRLSLGRPLFTFVNATKVKQNTQQAFTLSGIRPPHHIIGGHLQDLTITPPDRRKLFPDAATLSSAVTFVA